MFRTSPAQGSSVYQNGVKLRLAVKHSAKAARTPTQNFTQDEVL